MKQTTILTLTTAVFVALAPRAFAADCSPTALGTSRVMSLAASEFPLIGTLNYRESIRLNNREVVLTFADGPSAPYTTTILDALAAECVKATFFVTGNTLLDAGDILRREINEGHTVGTHTFSGDSLADKTLQQAKDEIDKGVTSAAEAAGNRDNIAPFFRAPDLEISKGAERYALSKGLSIWSGDVDSEDWNLSTEEEFVSKTIAEIEKSGKGIVLLHDAQPVTARGIKPLLEELKARKFKIVHVVPGKRLTTTGSAR